MNQKIELVLTAHPTEAQRRSALKKHEQMLQQMKVWDVGRALAVAGGKYNVAYTVKRKCWERAMAFGFELFNDLFIDYSI